VAATPPPAISRCIAKAGGATQHAPSVTAQHAPSVTAQRASGISSSTPSRVPRAARAAADAPALRAMRAAVARREGVRHSIRRWRQVGGEAEMVQYSTQQ
jgi:hypothetical protein